MTYFSIILFFICFCITVLYVLHRFNTGWLGKGMVFIGLSIIPFWDGILSKGIMWKFEKQNLPMMKIIRTVTDPHSVLWIDQVWPGFDEYSQRVMIETYLDGVHLKKLALNDGKGNILLYQVSSEQFLMLNSLLSDIENLQEKTNSILNRISVLKKEGGDVSNLVSELNERLRPVSSKKVKLYQLERQKVTANILATGTAFELPQIELTDFIKKFEYSVEINEIPLAEWKQRFIWCDEISINDNKNRERIAFSKRCLGFSPKFGINPVGKSQPFYGGTRIGNYDAYGFDDSV